MLGHEFVAEILEHGPETEGTSAVGGVVCAVPTAVGAAGVDLVGFNTGLPGGFGELVVQHEAALLAVPEGLDPRAAALTEPLAVGEHAVALGDPRPGWPCHVVGCGPIGLTIILALRTRGLGPIIASDPAPVRGELARRLGADVVLDPGQGSGFPDFGALHWRGRPPRRRP